MQNNNNNNTINSNSNNNSNNNPSDNNNTNDDNMPSSFNDTASTNTEADSLNRMDKKSQYHSIQQLCAPINNNRYNNNSANNNTNNNNNNNDQDSHNINISLKTQSNQRRWLCDSMADADDEMSANKKAKYDMSDKLPADNHYEKSFVNQHSSRVNSSNIDQSEPAADEDCQNFMRRLKRKQSKPKPLDEDEDVVDDSDCEDEHEEENNFSRDDSDSNCDDFKDFKILSFKRKIEKLENQLNWLKKNYEEFLLSRSYKNLNNENCNKILENNQEQPLEVKLLADLLKNELIHSTNVFLSDIVNKFLQKRFNGYRTFSKKTFEDKSEITESNTVKTNNSLVENLPHPVFPSGDRFKSDAPWPYQSITPPSDYESFIKRSYQKHSLLFNSFNKNIPALHSSAMYFPYTHRPNFQSHLYNQNFLFQNFSSSPNTKQSFDLFNAAQHFDSITKLSSMKPGSGLTEEPEQTEAISLVVTPNKKKRTKVTDCSLSPKCFNTSVYNKHKLSNSDNNNLGLKSQEDLETRLTSTTYRDESATDDNSSFSSDISQQTSTNCDYKLENNSNNIADRSSNFADTFIKYEGPNNLINCEKLNYISSNELPFRLKSPTPTTLSTSVAVLNPSLSQSNINDTTCRRNPYSTFTNLSNMSKIQGCFNTNNNNVDENNINTGNANATSCNFNNVSYNNSTTGDYFKAFYHHHLLGSNKLSKMRYNEFSGFRSPPGDDDVVSNEAKCKSLKFNKVHSRKDNIPSMPSILCGTHFKEQVMISFLVCACRVCTLQ
ncbi:hypothetical protein HELRODRAFT_163975 [Helobdella robusta]|uniref:Uncharacterized protein n=1 Tax=Helobdella robusta TaxID=6412 RepID=T1EUP7_HELRO|nr:hypothetical protein HELRODRAFT_163975 [Helobdella robusta]ESN94186.1 hypothetical protein HELRODRAFT_163975 [Helobdella robusta]